MIGWILRVVIAFAILTLIYFAFLFLSSFYARQKFAREYADRIAPGAAPSGAEGSVDLRAQTTFVDQRMDKFRRNTRWRWGLTIYGIPVVAFGVLIWLAQFS